MSFFLFIVPCGISGLGDVVHVSSEDRINLYPAAPIRLATMLNAWIIAGWMGLIFCPALWPSRHGATHPTRQRSLSQGVEVVLFGLDHSWFYLADKVAPSGIRPVSR